MKKRNVILSLISLAVLSLTSAIIMTHHDEFTPLDAESKEYSLVINKDNAYITSSPYSSNESIKTVYTTDKNPIDLGYIRGMKPTVSSGQGNENTFIQIGSSGCLYNKTAITGIKSVKATFHTTNALYLNAGNSVNPTTNQVALESGVEQAVNNYSYISLLTDNRAAWIDELVITYYCSSFPGSGDTSSEEEVTLDSIEITGSMDKKTYTVGEEWDYTGLELTGYYSDDTNQNLGDLSTLIENDLALVEASPSKPALGVEDVTILVMYGSNLLEDSKTIVDIVVNEPVTPPEDNSFVLATNTNNIKIGSKIIITNINKNYALSTTQNSNNRGQTSISVNDNKITNVSSSVEVMTVESGNTASSYALKAEAGYLYATSATSNILRSKATLDDKASWIITFEGEVALINNVSYTSKYIEYNSSSSCFSSYSSTMGDIAIFVNNNGADIGGGEDPITPPVEEGYDNYYAPNDYSYSSTFPANYNELDDIYLYDCDSTPSLGNVNVLVVPIAFTDSTVDNGVSGTNIINDLETVFNGTKEETGWHSVSSYFKECSYGALNLSFTVAPTWYQYEKSKSVMGVADTSTTISAVTSSVEWYRSQYSSSNCKEFDSDSNGYIDCVFLVYAEKDYASGRTSYDNFWAYTFWTQQNNRNVSKPNANTFIWMSYDFMYGDMGGSSLIDLDSHTFVHEYGHAMGLNDYYDYGGNEAPAGGFDMQDFNVGDHNPFSKMSLGWSKPYVVDGNARITIKPHSKYANQTILLASGGYNGWNKSPFDEYILIEFYTPEGLNYFDSHNDTFGGYPMGTKDIGLRVYHVDCRLYGVYNGYLQGYATSINSGYLYLVAATNTTSGDHVSQISEAVNYRQVHLLSQSGTDRMKNKQMFNSVDLFTEGDTFSMSDYSSFFYNKGKFNDNSTLGFSFYVENIAADGATIRFDEI